MQQEFLAVDPGASTGLALFGVEGSPTHIARIRITSQKGATRLEEYFDELEKKGVGLVVVEYQYQLWGMSFKSKIGLACNRGAVEHVARRRGMKVVRVEPGNWKKPVHRFLGLQKMDSAAKQARLEDFGRKLADDPSLHADAATAVVLGHWYRNQGLFA